MIPQFEFYFKFLAVITINDMSFFSVEPFDMNYLFMKFGN